MFKYMLKYNIENLLPTKTRILRKLDEQSPFLHVEHMDVACSTTVALHNVQFSVHKGLFRVYLEEVFEKY